MSESAWIVDAGVGETRAARLQDGAAAELFLWRPGEDGRRAALGEIYAARARSVEPHLKGAFLDLGQEGPAAFLRGPAREGALLAVEIVREAARGKGPVARATPWTGALPDRPLRLQPAAQPFPAAATPNAEARAFLDEAFAAALSTIVALPGGGALHIEPTAALTAIDVDAGGRRGAGGDPERFALALNLLAAETAFAELRRRCLGGLAAIDFISLRQPESRKRLATVLGALARSDTAQTIVAPLSRFGVAEIARPQTHAPLHERMRGPEADAWALLRAMEREAAHAHGRVVTAEAPPAILAALAQSGIDWRAGLSARIGIRWTLTAAPELPPGAAHVYLKDR